MGNQMRLKESLAAALLVLFSAADGEGPSCACPGGGFIATAPATATVGPENANGAKTCFILCRCKSGCGCTQKIDDMSKQNVALLGVFKGQVGDGNGEKTQAAVEYMRSQYRNFYISSRALQKLSIGAGLNSTNCKLPTGTKSVRLGEGKTLATTFDGPGRSTISAAPTIQGSSNCGFPIPKCAKESCVMTVHPQNQWQGKFKKLMKKIGYSSATGFESQFDDLACKKDTGSTRYYANVVTLTMKQALVTGQSDSGEATNCKCFVRYQIGIFTHPTPGNLAKGEGLVSGGVESTAVGAIAGNTACKANDCKIVMTKLPDATMGLDDAVRSAVGKIRFDITRELLQKPANRRRRRRRRRRRKKKSKMSTTTHR